MTSVTSPVHDLLCTGSFARRRGMVVLGAVLGATISWLFARLVGDVDVSAPGMPTSDVGQIVAVIISSAVAGLLAWALLELLERYTKRPWRNWTIIAAIAFVVSLLGPLSAETDGGRVQLAVMHAIVAAILYRGVRLTMEPGSGR